MAGKRKADYAPEEWAVLSAKKSLADKQYRESNLDALREKKRQYYKANKDKWDARREVPENRVKKRIRDKEYAARKRDQLIEYKRKYFRENKENLKQRKDARMRDPDYAARMKAREKAYATAYRERNRALLKEKAKQRYASIDPSVKEKIDAQKRAEYHAFMQTASSEELEKLRKAGRERMAIYRAEDPEKFNEKERRYRLRVFRRKAQMHLQQVLQFGIGLE